MDDVSMEEADVIFSPGTPVWLNGVVSFITGHLVNNVYSIDINGGGEYHRNEFQILIPSDDEYRVKINGDHFSIVKVKYFHPNGVVLSRNRFVQSDNILTLEQCIGKTIINADPIARIVLDHFVTRNGDIRVNGRFATEDPEE